VQHYNGRRPHRALDLEPPDPTPAVAFARGDPPAPLTTLHRRDLLGGLERLVDESAAWKHTAEGDRNPWAHVRAVLTASSVTIPLQEGELALGDLQTIFFCEFDGPRERRIHITVT
jgi:Uncharacterised protein family UPF0047